MSLDEHQVECAVLHTLLQLEFAASPQEARYIKNAACLIKA